MVIPGPELRPKAMSGCVTLLQLRSVLMSITHVIMRATGATHTLKFEGHAELTLPFTCPGDSWPCPSLNSAAGELVSTLIGNLSFLQPPNLGKMTLSLTTGLGELVPMVWE